MSKMFHAAVKKSDTFYLRVSFDCKSGRFSLFAMMLVVKKGELVLGIFQPWVMMLD